MRALQLEGIHKWNLTGVKKISNSGPAVWEFKCGCGQTTSAVASDFIRGRIKSCGCLMHRSGKDHPAWHGLGKLSSCVWCTLKSLAKRRGLLFQISKKYALDLYESQKGKCALTGVPIELQDIRRTVNKRRSTKTASLDRINSDRGYTKDNVQWVHKTVNKMKWDTPQSEFIDWCKKVAEHNK